MSVPYDRKDYLGVQEEALLRDNPARWVILPIKFPNIWKLFKEHEHDFWTAEQAIDNYEFEKEMADVRVNEKVLEVVTFEAFSDVHLYGNLSVWTCGLLEEITIPEGRAFYGFECAFSTIQHEVLVMLWKRLITYAEIKPQDMIDKVVGINAVVAKTRWVKMRMDEAAWKMPFAEKLLVHAVIKHIMNATRRLFSALLHRDNLLPLIESVFVRCSRTDNLHYEFACTCYDMLTLKLPSAFVKEVVDGAVAVEQEYAFTMLRELFRLTEEDVKHYVRHVGDTVAELFGVTTNITPNPFKDSLDLDSYVHNGSPNREYLYASENKPSQLNDEGDFGTNWEF